MSAGGYESWFVSARDPGGGRGLWLRHTRYQPRQGAASAALWCTLADRNLADRPMIVKQVFAAFPAEATAGPERFRGQAALGDREAHWDLAVSEAQPPLRPLPELLMKAPLPRTKLEVSVPDGWITGTVGTGGHTVEVSRWRGTVGHNWGSGHADTWVWLHAEFGTAPGDWLDLVLARIKVGPVLVPWTAMGAVRLDGRLIPLGGLGRRTRVQAQPGRLTATAPAPRAQVQLTVTAAHDDTVAVGYADPSGTSRTVTHAALAQVEVAVARAGGQHITRSGRGGYEFGTSQPVPGVTPQPLPAG